MRTLLIWAIALSCIAQTNVVNHVYWERGYHDNGNLWWMKAHQPDTNAPSFHIDCGQRYGWINIMWMESVTGKWHQVYSGGQYGDRFGDFLLDINTFKVYMHTNSPLTKKMLESKHGFFTMQSPNYGETWWDGSFRDWFPGNDAHIESVDMTGFFPASTNEFTGTPSTNNTPPPIP